MKRSSCKETRVIFPEMKRESEWQKENMNFINAKNIRAEVHILQDNKIASNVSYGVIELRRYTCHFSLNENWIRVAKGKYENYNAKSAQKSEKCTRIYSAKQDHNFLDVAKNDHDAAK